MTTLAAAGSTDPGQVRTQNQDTFVVSSELVLIADGMGGYAGGEVAAAIAAEVVAASFAASTSATGLEDAVRDANRRIYEHGVEAGLEGMGTTLVAVAVVRGDATARLLLVNVGDSRCYLLRGSSLRQLTADHSVAAELVRLGRIDEDESAEHPGRHVLTRVLGVDQDVDPDLIDLPAQQGDRLLLCSDGLSNELVDDEIVRLLAVGSPSDAARALVAAANAHGGLDNITAVVADVLDAPSTPVEHHTTAVPVVPPGTRVTPAPSSVAGAVAPLALRPVLSGRERRRRRREDRRARRRWNKWVSLRGAVFLLLFASVFVGGYFVLRWYATSNYIVTVRGHHVVVLQGQPGGFLWWPPKVIETEAYGPLQLAVTVRPQLTPGLSEPTQADAESFLSNFHAQWCKQHENVCMPNATTTTTSTTLPAYVTGGT